MFPNTSTNHPASILNELTQCPSDPDTEILEPYIALPEVIPSTDPEVTLSTEHEVNITDFINSTADHPVTESSELPVPTNTMANLNEEKIRPHRDHPIDKIIGDISAGVRTRASSSFGLFVNFISRILPKKIHTALLDSDWIKSMQEELNEFKRHNV